MHHFYTIFAPNLPFTYHFYNVITFSANRRTLQSSISDVLSDPGVALLKQHNLSRTLDPSKPAQITFAENETAKSDHQKMVASIRERNQRLQKMNTELENELRTLVEDRVQTGSKQLFL